MLIFFVLLLLGACSPASRTDKEGPAENTTLPAEVQRLSDSITGLKTQLALLQKEKLQNDSLSQVVAALLTEKQRLSKSQPPVVPSSSESKTAQANLQLEANIKTLQKQKDSLLAANNRVVRQLENVNMRANERDSLARLNGALRDRLSSVQQKLAVTARQKKQDSLAMAASLGSATQQQQELKKLARLRDSLRQSNRQLANRLNAAERQIGSLADQIKQDSLRMAKALTDESGKAATTRQTAAKQQQEKDSLSRVARSLASRLSASEQTIGSLREEKKKDSLAFVALLAEKEKTSVVTPPAAVAAQPNSRREADSLKAQIQMLENQLAAQHLQQEPAEEEVAAEETVAPADSLASIKRWAVGSAAPERDLREGFRLLLLAQQAEKTDPTLSLKLLREALRYSDDPLIIKETQRVYDTYYFYETLVQKSRPARSISLNETYLAVNLSNDSAYLYHGIDTVLQAVQGYSKVSAVMLPPQPYLFTGHRTGEVTVHNLATGKQAARFKAHDERITTLAFIGKNNSFLATGSTDKTIYLWTNKYEKTHRLVGLRAAVTSIDVSRSMLIAGASGDMSPRLWNTDGKLLLNLASHKDSVYSLDVSDNARYLLTTSRDKTAVLWDLKGNFVRAYAGHRAALTHGIFSHNQRLVALASADGSIILWNVNGTRLGTLTGHRQQVNQLVFDKTDTYLYSCSDDGTVRRWLVKKPGEIDLSIIPPLSEKELAGLRTLK